MSHSHLLRGYVEIGGRSVLDEIGKLHLIVCPTSRPERGDLQAPGRVS